MRRFYCFFIVFFSPMIILSQINSHQENKNWYHLFNCHTTGYDMDTYSWYWDYIFQMDYPRSIELMRCDNNDGSSELKLVGFLGGEDFIMSYNPELDKVSWEETTTNCPNLYDSSMGNIRVYSGVGNFNVKRGLDINLFFPMTKQNGNDLGYNVKFHFKYPEVVNVSYQLDFKEEYPNSDIGIVEFTENWKLSYIKYVVIEGTNNNNDEIYEYIKGNRTINDLKLNIGEDINASNLDVKTASFVNGRTIELKIPFYKTSPYTIYIVGYDNEDDWLIMDKKVAFATLIENDKWIPLGKGKMTEPIVANAPYSFSPDIDVEVPNWLGMEYDVYVEKSKNMDGLYRIVNPMGKGTPFENFTFFIDFGMTSHKSEFLFDKNSGKQYFIIIHAEDPDNVWCEPSLMGAVRCQNDDTYDEITTASGFDYYNIYGRKCSLELVDNVIRTRDRFFPEAKYKFELKLPQQSSMEGVNIDNDNCRTIYYNLQGQIIDNPTTGLYIIKRGGKVSKKIIH